MMKRPLSLLITALTAASTGVYAGPPGQNTNGSTVQTVSAEINGFDFCIAANIEKAKESDGAASARAFASASQFFLVGAEGDVTLDLTRHGQNGAVHQAELTGKMGSLTLYAQNSATNVKASASAEAEADVEAEAVVERIAEALASIFIGIDFPVISVKAGAQADGSGYAEGEAVAEATASAAADADADGNAGASAGAFGVGAAGTSSSFYVQGAKIEEFSSLMSLNSRSFNKVNTKAMAKTYADAFATASAWALAKASVEAEAKGELEFVYDLPFIGSGSLPIVTDFNSASASAEVIADASAEISAEAKAWARASSELLAGSFVNLGLQVEFEDLPGPASADKLEIAAVLDGALFCKGSVKAKAGADAN